MVDDLAYSYFRTLNPLASKIHQDIESLKVNCELIWKDLSTIEQDTLINNGIIHPHAILKYSSSVSADCIPTTCIFSSGSKVICDELTGSTWRDEHSGPFSWNSRSILCLCKSMKCLPANSSMDAMPSRKYSITSSNQESAKYLENEENSLPAVSNFRSFFKIFPGKSLVLAFNEKNKLSRMTCDAVEKLQNFVKTNSSSSTGEHYSLVSKKNVIIAPCQNTDFKTAGFKPKCPPPPPPPSHVFFPCNSFEDVDGRQPMLNDENNCVVTRGPNTSVDIALDEKVTDDESNEKSNGDTLPKSGFDFLDNW